MKRTAAGASLVVLLALNGCASMNADECVMSDWQTICFEDGARGYTMDRLGQHRKACAKHGVAPDLRAYQSRLATERPEAANDVAWVSERHAEP